MAAAALASCVFATSGDAQILIWPPQEVYDSIEAPDGEAEPPEEDLVKVLQFDAAAEPEPALRYRFWPVVGKEVPGNAMAVIQRANVLRLEPRANGRPDAMVENYDRWMDGPLEELPRDDIRAYLKANQQALFEIHRAALMLDSSYEIGLEALKGPDVVWLTLSDLQNARDLARLLQLEIRLALAERRYEDAIDSLRAGFRLAEAVGQSTDLLVGRLIGFAIAGVMTAQVQEMITLPDSPNLYWALASLPPSIWEIRESLEYEANLTQRVFPTLEELPETESSNAAWREHLINAAHDYLSLGSLTQGDDHTTEARLLAGMLVVGFSESARSYLEQLGYPSQRVATMSPSEAVLRGTWEHVRRIQDDFAKWALLSRPTGEGYWPRERELEVLQGNGSFPDPATALVSLLMPATRAAQSAGIRTEQTVAFVATIEAIRMHAAKHGRLPESLENLQPVPAFRDPATGELFEYQRSSETEARLERVEVSPGQPDTVVRLELTK